MKFKPKYIIDSAVNFIKKAYSRSFLKSMNLFGCIKLSFEVSWKASAPMFLARLFMSFYNSFIQIFLIWVSKLIIDYISGFLKHPEPFTGDVSKRFFTLLAISFGVLIFNDILGKMMGVINTIHQDRISNHIRVEMLKKMSTLDISFFDSAKFYDELMNAKRDSNSLSSFIWQPINIIQAIVQFITVSVILMKLNWIIPLAIVVLALPSNFMGYRLQRVIYEWNRKKAKDLRKIGYVESILGSKTHAKEIRIFDIFDNFIIKFLDLWGAMHREQCKILVKRNIYYCIMSILPYLPRISLTIYLGKNIIEGRMTVGEFTFYTGLLSQGMGAVSSLSSSILQFMQHTIQIKNYIDFIKTPSRLMVCGNAKPDKNPCIEFKNVSFKYPGSDKFVFENLNFKIEAREKVAFVGLNGAGKSTIVKLILRLYDPTEGEVLINGNNIKSYDLKELRKLYSVVFQDFANYALKVNESIVISDITESENQEKILKACSMSGVDDMLSKWKDGLDTYLTRQFDQDGVELSGGQWQKLALARGFFREADIIILDEPNASLDPEAEAKLFDIVKQLFHNKGAIIISHKLSSIKMADRIIVLEKGSIIENGTHEELLEKKGRYHYLFNLQAEKYMFNDHEKVHTSKMVM